jgi:ABC-type cobalamin/Fe3+-siderophores transport system ATPase subunit
MQSCCIGVLKNMRFDRVRRIAEDHSVFLVGPNGAGKSRTLKALCEHLRARDPGYSMAVSNTPYVRLPVRAYSNYSHIKVGSATTNSLLRQVLSDALESESFGLISMREVFSYTGYAPLLGIRIQVLNPPKRVQYPSEGPPRAPEDGILREDYEDYDAQYGVPDDPEVERLTNGLERITGRHIIDLNDASGFLVRFQDVVRTVKYKSAISRRLSKSGKRLIVSFSLVRDNGSYIELNEASSGELTLITIAIFALSRRGDLHNIFIDEPENSLHPLWQVKFFEFITSLLRREGIKFFFATHSAVLANGALSSDIPVHIIRCRGDDYEEIVFSRRDTDESVEQLLWEAFDTVTPASSYLSETISNLVWDVEENRVSAQAALILIDQYIKKSFSDHQKEFLLACKKLIGKIEE